MAAGIFEQDSDNEEYGEGDGEKVEAAEESETWDGDSNGEGKSEGVESRRAAEE